MGDEGEEVGKVGRGMRGKVREGGFDLFNSNKPDRTNHSSESIMELSRNSNRKNYTDLTAPFLGGGSQFKPPQTIIIVLRGLVFPSEQRADFPSTNLIKDFNWPRDVSLSLSRESRSNKFPF